MMSDTELKALWIPAYHRRHGSNCSVIAEWPGFMNSYKSEYQKTSDHLVLVFNAAATADTSDMSFC